MINLILMLIIIVCIVIVMSSSIIVLPLVVVLLVFVLLRRFRVLSDSFIMLLICVAVNLHLICWVYDCCIIVAVFCVVAV